MENECAICHREFLEWITVTSYGDCNGRDEKTYYTTVMDEVRRRASALLDQGCLGHS
jgi:hypothetical protein